MTGRILDALTRIPERLAAWAASLTTAGLAVIGLGVLAAVAAGGFYAYRTYDYVQHDNDFCMSCHLMQQPYELFAQSAHQGLGCKACHQPTLMARTQMALTQIVENPGEISVHAEVPNERCAECHIEGDPEKWRLIANSAGHKVHLESDDPSLGGLQCVECHSTSVHEFSPVDRTCSQSGCHDDKKILLGGMSELTIHCAACHSFLAPVAAAASADSLDPVGSAIRPDQDECFSCHVMRELVEMPRPDPHEGVCSSCHNPHTQTTPAEAVESCATAGCHTEAEALSPMHRGMQPGVLEDCTFCHQAHDFKVDGVRCIDCHQDLDAGATGVPNPHRTGEAPPSAASQPVGLAGVGVGWWVHEAPEAQERPRFLHTDHRVVSCTSCHTTDDSHGGLRVVTLEDCRSCHHEAPLANDCARCHASEEMPTATFRQVRPVRFSVGSADSARAMEFPHARHEGITCGTCHTRGTALSAAGVDCASCHQDHHEPASPCAACHTAPARRAHPVIESHQTCAGSACHQDPPFASVPRTRNACLVCHQTQEEHKPGRVCVECHTLPSPREGGVEPRP